MTDIEILQSLPSLYPLKDFEEEAILNVCKMFEDIKAEIRHFELPSVTPRLFINETTEKEGIDFETVEKIIDKYKTESEVNNEN